MKTTQQLLLLQIIFSVTWSKPALSEIQTLPILFFVHPNRNIRTSRIEEKKILETMKKKTRNWVQQRIFPWICFGFLFTLELQRVNDDVIFFWTLPNLRKKPQFFYVPLLFYLKKKKEIWYILISSSPLVDRVCNATSILQKTSCFQKGFLYLYDMMKH